MTMVTPEEYYAKIADFYDEETKDPIMLAEDIVLFQFLKDEGMLSGSFLDAGCGTGLLLDQCYWPKWEVTHYEAYDLSEAMLQKMRSKWPSFRDVIHKMSFDSDHTKFKDSFDSVVSLYAGLNCLSRPQMYWAFRNLWDCVKKGDTMCLMTYGNVKPEDRETSLHSIISETEGYPYTMIEESVLYTWMRDLANSANHRVLPFSQALDPNESTPTNSSDNMESILYHRTRIENDLDEALITSSKKGGTNSPSCSFFLCLADKI